jgi:hypothetical protein
MINPPAYYGAPAAPAPPQSNAVKWLLITVAVLVALFLGLLTLVLTGLATGVAGLISGIVLALLPLPVYMLLVFWIDRFEKEPLWMLAAAFIWGSTVAVFSRSSSTHCSASSLLTSFRLTPAWPRRSSQHRSSRSSRKERRWSSFTSGRETSSTTSSTASSTQR